MSHIIADNIVSALGITTEQNLDALLRGESALQRYDKSKLEVASDYVASFISDDIIALMRNELQKEPEYSNLTQAEIASLSCFEVKVAYSVLKALRQTYITPGADNVQFVLSTTKGEIERGIHLGETAKRIAQRLGFRTEPIVVSNACVSGLSALITADRLVFQRHSQYAVVCGTDDIGRFVVSGFQSLKAFSAERCRPFDIDRMGLNLGEAVSTVILSENGNERTWRLVDGRIKNDAYHISSPSRGAEGALLSILPLLNEIERNELAVVNLHGTATVFNDQMESVAMDKSQLSDIPQNGLKGTLGHTLGAAGLIESVLTMHAIERGVILPTCGYAEQGTSERLNLSSKMQNTSKRTFLKTLAGFGGVNAAAIFQKGKWKRAVPETKVEFKSCIVVEITPSTVCINDVPLDIQQTVEKHFLASIYKQCVDDYPKFYKMDGLSRLGFLASELLLQQEQAEADTNTLPRFMKRNDRAIVMYNSHSSISADCKFIHSLGRSGDKETYFPSPSVFVYTLPNIVTGEVAIRNKYQGETQFFVLPRIAPQTEQHLLEVAFSDPDTQSAVAGVVEYINANAYYCRLQLYQRTNFKN